MVYSLIERNNEYADMVQSAMCGETARSFGTYCNVVGDHNLTVIHVHRFLLTRSAAPLSPTQMSAKAK